MHKFTFIRTGASVLMMMLASSCYHLSFTADSPDIDPYNDFYSYLSTGEFEGVRVLREQILWRHWDVDVQPDNTAMRGGPNIVDAEFDVIVLENSYTAITLLPEYGGRMLSYYYKPTGTEQLYQNPVGTPFAFGDGTFFYDWLKVYGGVFPTFPEAEHGKSWIEPWEYEILQDGTEDAAVRMWFTDDAPNPPRTPASFTYGTTGMTVVVTYRLRQGSAVAEMEVELINNRDVSIEYEYWTCLTLAPGSEPQNTRTTEAAKMIMPLELVEIDYAPRRWMGTERIQPFENFSEMTDWRDMGILYAYPYMQENWYAVLNRDNNQAIIRIGDNTATPGLKFWTWGHNQGSSINPFASSFSAARPYIELWSGVSRKFFESARLDAHETMSWTEYYYPTVGLADISYANENAAVLLVQNEETENTDLKIYTFLSRPQENYSIHVLKDGETLMSEQHVSQPDSPQSILLPELPSSEYRLELRKSGEVLLQYDFIL
ncbi:DUF5107 domain-containing protein [Spirochaeta dissipatitropha]